MTDAKTEQEMREYVKRVDDRSKKDGVGTYEAIKREGLKKTTYYMYKERLERMNRNPMLQVLEVREIPENPSVVKEDLFMPSKEKFQNEKHRISIDLPHDDYKYIDEEHIESTMSIKSMCQKIVINYVRDRRDRGEPLFKAG
jgi:hypothetical protein